MANGSVLPVSVPEAAAQIAAILSALDPAARTKVISTILLWFPEEAPIRMASIPERQTPVLSPSDGSTIGTVPYVPTRFERLSKRVQSWLRRYSLADEVLERVFDMDGDMGVIVSVPGTTKREGTVNCYLLTGVVAFLHGDEPKFHEADALSLCKRENWYDGANHAQTRTTFGSRIIGSKDSGYSLPAPGLEAAALLIKAIAAER